MTLHPNSAAFPTFSESFYNEQKIDSYTAEGLTRHQLFAALILQGLCANTVLTFVTEDENPHGTWRPVGNLPKTAVKLAHELIEALNSDGKEDTPNLEDNQA